MRGPTPIEDAKNAGFIGGSALVGILATVALLGGDGAPADAPATIHEDRSSAPVRVVFEWSRAPAVEHHPMVEHKVAADRIFGTVRAIGSDGDVSLRSGFLRWDRNEGSWVDLLDAAKAGPEASTAGVRFGHVSRIEPSGSDALVTLRSGRVVRLESRATDLGPRLRKLVVDGVDGRETTFEWKDIEQVSFEPAPDGATPSEGLLYGTLATTSGMEFTGFVAWDMDEILASDVLDGDVRGERRKIPFGAVASISRDGPEAAWVTLHSGEGMLMSGTNDVDRRNNGITVSDPALGVVKVRWDQFERVRFHEPASEQPVHDFDGGKRVVGTVLATSGEEFSGRIQWDADESESWELLDGEAGGVEFQIEFSKIASIAKNADGAAVTLRDGRSFDLTGSNDVNRDNRGIVVATDTQQIVMPWKDFVELRLEG